MRILCGVAVAAAVICGGAVFLCDIRPGISATSLADEGAVAPLEEKSFTDPQSGLTLRLPKGWVPKKGIDHTGVEAPERERGGGGSLAPNIVLSKDPSFGSKPADLPDLLKKKSAQYAKAFSEYKELLVEPRTVGDNQGWLVRSSFKIKNVLTIEMEQIWVIKDAQIYIATFTSLEATWEKNEKVFEASMKTLQIP